MQENHPVDVAQETVVSALHRETQAMLERSLDALWTADFNAESRLAGWSVGHVATYLARQADEMSDRLLVATGHPVPEFDAERRWDLERGSLRPGAVLIDDLHESADRLTSALAGVPDWAALDDGTRALPGRRLLQVLVHGADLGRDWQSVSVDDAELAVALLARLRADELAGIRLIPVRDSEQLTVSTATETDTVVEGPPRALLAWATGRPADSPAGAQGETLPRLSRVLWY